MGSKENLQLTSFSRAKRATSKSKKEMTVISKGLFEKAKEGNTQNVVKEEGKPAVTNLEPPKVFTHN